VRRTLLLELSLLFALAVVGELVLRHVDPRYGHHLFDDEFTGGYPIQLNGDGFRGPPVPKAKEPGEYRVLALGDSVTFGVGVASDDTWPARLGSLLARDRRASVVNIAFPGTGLRDLAYGLEHGWADYHPDAIVLALSNNHVSLGWIQRGEAARMPRNPTPLANRSARERLLTDARRAAKSLHLLPFLSRNSETLLYQIGLLDHRINAREPFGAMLAHGYRQLDVPSTLPEEAWRIVEQQVLAIDRHAKAMGAKLFVTMVPSRFMLSDDFSDNVKAVPKNRLGIVPVERVQALAARRGLAFIDTLAALKAARTKLSNQRGERPALYIQGDYTHLDADGHAALAGAVSARLF